MNLKSRFLNAVLAMRINGAFSTMGKKEVLRLIHAACKLRPQWAKNGNVAFLMELVEKEHPFFQWTVAMRRDLHPRILSRFIRNVLFTSFIGDRRKAEYEEKNGTPPLSNLLFSVTERCNMRCEGCWAAEYDKSDDLPLALMDRVVHELKEMGAGHCDPDGRRAFPSGRHLRSVQNALGCFFSGIHEWDAHHREGRR